MDARQLRYFQAVCEHRNVTHAAERCNVAQSAISHHVARLEDEFGVPLFKRLPRGMEPTAAGLRLYDHARRILKSMEHARDDLRSGSSDLVGDITIGMPFSVIKVIGADLMRFVMHDHPRVRLVLAEMLSGLIYENLIAGEMELALTYNPPPDKVTEREPLLKEELFCIGRPGIVGDSATPIAFDKIGDLPLALLKSGTLSRALVERSASMARLEAKTDLQLASIAASIGALEAGLACTIAPKVLVAEQLASGTLVARPIVNPKPVRTLVMLTRSDARPTRLRETIGDVARELTRQAVTEGRWLAAKI